MRSQLSRDLFSSLHSSRRALDEVECKLGECGFLVVEESEEREGWGREKYFRANPTVATGSG